MGTICNTVVHGKSIKISLDAKLSTLFEFWKKLAKFEPIKVSERQKG
jgi:hypothetical protein